MTLRDDAKKMLPPATYTGSCCSSADSDNPLGREPTAAKAGGGVFGKMEKFNLLMVIAMVTAIVAWVVIALVVGDR